MTKIVEDVKLDYSDVLLQPKRSEVDSRSKVSLSRKFKFKHSKTEISAIPIIAANMDHTGTMEMARTLAGKNMFTALHKFYSPEELFAFFSLVPVPLAQSTFYSLGITNDDIDKLLLLLGKLKDSSEETFGPRLFCIDVANGYSRKFVNFVESFRDRCSEYDVIMAGNVATPDMAYDLLERGADIVKIGIGPGSVCTTRKQTGVGYPQLSAVMECADAAHGVDGHICADGGITCPGDIAKAFAAGADFVMCGGLFAGHKECSGHIKTKGEGDNLKHYMQFYGMSSEEAMKKHYGGKADYRAAEGKVVEIPYKGSIVNTVEEILGGLRSACTYVGASNLKDLPKCATFIKVNRQLNNSLDQFNA